MKSESRESRKAVCRKARRELAPVEDGGSLLLPVAAAARLRTSTASAAIALSSRMRLLPIPQADSSLSSHSVRANLAECALKIAHGNPRDLPPHPPNPTRTN